MRKMRTTYNIRAHTHTHYNRLRENDEDKDEYSKCGKECSHPLLLFSLLLRQYRTLTCTHTISCVEPIMHKVMLYLFVACFQIFETLAA